MCPAPLDTFTGSSRVKSMLTRTWELLGVDSDNARRWKYLSHSPEQVSDESRYSASRHYYALAGQVQRMRSARNTELFESRCREARAALAIATVARYMATGREFDARWAEYILKLIEVPQHGTPR